MKLALLGITVAACWGPPAHSSADHAAADAPATEALRGARFADAARLATDRLATDPHDSDAAAVRAVAGYEQAAAVVYEGLDMHNHWFAVEALLTAKPVLLQAA